MTIKGTLETFNLLDLLQMLSFNQKVGTLTLETARVVIARRGNDRSCQERKRTDDGDRPGRKLRPLGPEVAGDA